MTESVCGGSLGFILWVHGMCASVREGARNTVGTIPPKFEIDPPSCDGFRRGYIAPQTLKLAPTKTKMLHTQNE